MAHIKGLCENFGLAYEGDVKLKDGVFPVVVCPNCNKITYNFDNATSVDELDKEEGKKIDYTKVTFK